MRRSSIGAGSLKIEAGLVSLDDRTEIHIRVTVDADGSGVCSSCVRVAFGFQFEIASGCSFDVIHQSEAGLSQLNLTNIEFSGARLLAAR